MEGLLHTKPASAGMSREICDTQGRDKRDALGSFSVSLGVYPLQIIHCLIIRFVIPVVFNKLIEKNVCSCLTQPFDGGIIFF